MNAITPGVRCSAGAYDLANRRWFKLNVGDPPAHASWRHDTQLDQVPDDDWLSSTVAKHIKEHYSATNAPPTWNTINTTSSGSPVTYEKREVASVRQAIFETFSYGHRPSDKIQTVKFDEVQDKTYLGRGADYCLWQGRKCVFKRIEFDCDVESHEAEIRIRETLLQCMERDGGGASRDADQEMQRRFNVVPILAVVLHDETSDWMVSTRQTFEDGEDHTEDSLDEDALESAPIDLATLPEGFSYTEEYVSDDDPTQNEEPPPPDGHQVAGFLMPYAGRSLELSGAATIDPEGLRHTPTTLPAIGSLQTNADVPVNEG